MTTDEIMADLDQDFLKQDLLRRITALVFGCSF